MKAASFATSEVHSTRQNRILLITIIVLAMQKARQADIQLILILF